MNNYLDDLNEIKVLINTGKVVLCPTDTIWGLSCNAMDPSAVDKIYAIKKRDKSKPFILLVDSVAHLKTLVRHVHPRVETLIQYHLLPLSIVYQASDKLPPYLLSDKGTIAIRVTKHKMLSELIKLSGTPLVSTSANVQGETSPVNFQDISENILQSVDYVFETGRGKISPARSSQLISWDQDGELTFLR